MLRCAVVDGVECAMVTLHTASTAELTPSVVHGIRTLLDEAFDGAFTSDDWTHACGGVHVWLDGHVFVASLCPNGNIKVVVRPRALIG